jgi:hypothetical protein
VATPKEIDRNQIDQELEQKGFGSRSYFVRNLRFPVSQPDKINRGAITMLFIDKTKYTSDQIIRQALIQCVEKQYKDDNHPAKIVEEFVICDGAARVDLAAVNGVMHGFEIKSDIDSLVRLPQQMQYYSEVFNKMTLVVGATHLYDAFHLIPDWWGVTVARVSEDGEVIFNEIRKSETNQHIRPHSVAGLLWKKEALVILEEYGFSRGYKSKNRTQICEKLVSELDIETLSSKVREVIQFNRQGWRVVV